VDIAPLLPVAKNINRGLAHCSIQQRDFFLVFEAYSKHRSIKIVAACITIPDVRIYPEKLRAWQTAYPEPLVESSAEAQQHFFPSAAEADIQSRPDRLLSFACRIHICLSF
jgi:hypothetical protein